MIDKLPERPLMTDPFAAHRPRLLAACLLAIGAMAVPAQSGAETQTVQLSLAVGSQKELLFDKAIERIAVASEAVANIIVMRKTPGQPGARLLVTGKTAGQTTLMVWEKGNAEATTYVLTVQGTGGTVEGNFTSVEAHQQARAAAQAGQTTKTAVADRSIIDVRSNTVQVDVKVVEFNRSVLKQIGLNLGSTRANSHGFSFGTFSPASLNSFSLNANGSNTTDASPPLAQAFNLLFNFGRAGIGINLGLLEGNGMARVLAEPTLVALSGQSASFLSGGELPVPVPQGLGATAIEYKSFGIGLSVTPTVLSNDRIVLKVAPEASDLDYTNALAIGGIPVPAISTRRADTTVELGDGESFIIGGLVSRTTASNVDKVPLLGDLPVLGSFFRQNRYSMNEKELVILVTPRLVKPIARNTDLTTLLPGAAEQRDGPVWRSILLGGSSPTPIPGFSR
jgi:pilus assembly protein CpaC